MWGLGNPRRLGVEMYVMGDYDQNTLYTLRIFAKTK